MKTKTTKDIILDIVNVQTGIKATELVTATAVTILDAEVDHGKGKTSATADIVEAINELVKEGEIVELEYVIPAMSYRVKSLYFPKGTELKPVVNHTLN